MLRLNNLKSPEGAHKNIKRLGRGMGSGQGRRAGKGDKGQKARSGGGIRMGFEGGQMPLYRRLPKRGFLNAAFKVVYAVVNLEQIEKKFSNETVNRESLVKMGLLNGINKNLPIKILGKGKLEKSLKFEGIDKFSKKAEELIGKAGGKISKEGK